MHIPSSRFSLLLPCVVCLLCCWGCGTGSSTDKTEIIDHLIVGDYAPVRAALQTAIDCDGPLLPARGNVHLLHSYVRGMCRHLTAMPSGAIFCKEQKSQQHVPIRRSQWQP